MAKSSDLAAYKKKRNFSKTPEPEGEVHPSGSRLLFIIQKHDATRLHYDLRLELNGTLKSWAVPKGPSLDPAEKRLAVHVEDHPIEYGSFEGIIPKGEYGGGTVMLWDRGWWESIGDSSATYEKGHLKFRLHGEKLNGAWALVQMRGKSNEDGKNWLLIKEKDDAVRPHSEYDITADLHRSVKTGRTMDEIANAQDRVWTDAGEVAGEEVEEKLKKKPSSRRQKPAPQPTRTIDPSALAGAVKAEQPEFIPPQLATLAREVPQGDNFIHEVKFDGYRILAVYKNGAARLMSRNGLDWTAKLKSVARALESLPVEQAIIDGEVVVLNEEGISQFQLLQNLMRLGEKHPLYYYAFDLPHCAGHNLTRVPLLERKNLLQQVIQTANNPALRYSEHIAGSGDVVLQNACRLRLEGIVSKRADSPYEQRRSKSWLKVKCNERQEFIIVAWSDPSGSRSHFGSLLLGYHDADMNLVYCGRVGTGFNEKSLKSIFDQLRPLERSTAPVKNPPRGADARGVHWVEPKLICEVEFTEWTTDNQLRHPSFQGMREDKKPEQVKRETEQAVDDSSREETVATPEEKSPPKEEIAKPKTKSNSSRKTPEETVGGVRISNPGKVLYPEQGMTKIQLARYYESIAKWILPYVTGRPISLVRCPEGVGHKCFYQRHVNDTLPDTVRGVKIRTDEGVKDYIVIDEAKGLLGLVQLGVLEIHPWGCREDDIEHPDWMVMDLDPAPDVEWKRVIDGAMLVREKLESRGLNSFAKTTGGKGIHVVVPLMPRLTWDELKEYSRELAEEVVRENPGDFLATMSKAKRTGKIFVDYLRNGRTATSIAAYSTRARPGAPVSTPLSWEELRKGARPDAFTIETVPARMKKLKKDPWEKFRADPQEIK